MGRGKYLLKFFDRIYCVLSEVLMVQVCPISGDQVDERAGRIAAFFSLLLMVVAVGCGWRWAVLGLAAAAAVTSSPR